MYILFYKVFIYFVHWIYITYCAIYCIYCVFMGYNRIFFLKKILTCLKKKQKCVSVCYYIIWNGKSGWGNEIKCQNKSWLYSLILVAHQRSSSGPIHLKICHDFEVIPQDVYASTSALIKNCKSFCQCVSCEAINLYPVGHELCVEKMFFPLAKE